MEKHYSRDEVRKLLGISTGTLYRAIAAGQLPPPRKLGRRALWPASELQQALDRLPRADALEAGAPDSAA
jgi:excisionase family DNA binding protein